MSSISVTLERYAEIRAEMETGGLRDEVLKRAGVAVDEWAAVQRAWLERMATELQSGKFELTNLYTETFLARQQVLQASTRHQFTPKVDAPAPTHSLASVELPFAELPVATPIVVPGLSVASAPALAPTPVPRSSSIEGAIPTSLQGTLDLAQGMQIAMLARQILPFGPSGPSAAQSIAVANEPRIDESASNLLDQTIVGDALQRLGALPTATLPFDPSAPPSLEEVSPAEQPARKIADEIGETLDISAALRRGAPFGRTTPFEKPKLDKPEAPVLSLERYASLCVEYAAAPAQAPEIAQRYGLTREQWVRVDAYWRGEMASDPAVRAAWEKACVRYGEWLGRK